MQLRNRTRPHRLVAAVGQGMALSLLAMAAGCDTKAFIDPTEMTQTHRDPLVLPIVSQVDPALEEADSQWARATEPTADDLKPMAGDYRISPNDLLAITLSDINGPNTETVKQTRVTESGNISLPYLEKSIHAGGMTEADLEQAIVQAYKDANLIQHAQVSVTVIEARGRAFSILGSVSTPGEYAIVESDFRVLNALVQAHNVISPFVDYIYIIRRLGGSYGGQSGTPTVAPTKVTPPTTGPNSDELAPPKSEADGPPDTVAASVPTQHVVHLAETPPVPASDTPPAQWGGFNDPGPAQNVRIIRIPYQGLRAGDLKYNILIHPKDVIYVADPQTGYYYVGGHVARPGAYTLTGQKMTLKDAIISASMLDALAIPQRTEIIRRVNPDHEIFVQVDLEKIFAGEEPDIYIKPNDKIMVGTNALAPFLAAIRGGFRISYGFGFLFDRNYAYNNNGNAI